MTRGGCVRMDAVRRMAASMLLSAVAGCAGHSQLVVIKEPGPLDAIHRIAPLRVGVPAQHRWNLLFVCDAPASPPRFGSAAYVRDSLDTSGERWLRVPQPAVDSAGAMAPDTLVVRAFDEATDEEIAFERGELDAAVFWPGELSARMRFDARFYSTWLGDNSRVFCDTNNFCDTRNWMGNVTTTGGFLFAF